MHGLVLVDWEFTDIILCWSDNMFKTWVVIRLSCQQVNLWNFNYLWLICCFVLVQVLAKSSKMIPGFAPLLYLATAIIYTCQIARAVSISTKTNLLGVPWGDGRRLWLFMKLTAFVWCVAVMFMGALVYGVRYTLPEYLCTFLVAGGVSMFALFKVRSTKSCNCFISLAII